MDRAIPPLVLLALIVGAAAGLRLLRIGDWSLWLDEALTISDSLHVFNARHPWDVIHARPLNFWLTGWVLGLVPVAEWSARLVPAAAGIGSVAVAYFISKRVVGCTAALLLAAFLSLSAWHIYWSQNARGYSLLFLLSLISSFWFYTGVEAGDRVRISGSIIALGLAYLAHPVAAFLWLAYCAYLLLIPMLRFEPPPGLTRATVGIVVGPVALGGVAALPGAIGLGTRVLTTTQGGDALYVLATLGYYVQPTFVVLGVLGSLLLTIRRQRLGLFCCSLIVVPLVLLLAVTSVRGGSAVYVFHSLPAYYTATAVVLAGLMRTGGAGRIGGVVLVSLLAVQGAQVFEYFTHQHGDRPRWKEAVQYVAATSKPGDVILSTDAPVVDYYLGVEGTELRAPTRAVWIGERDLERLQTPERGWILVGAEMVGRWRWFAAQATWRQRCVPVRTYAAWTSGKDRSVSVYRCGA